MLVRVLPSLLLAKVAGGFFHPIRWCFIAELLSVCPAVTHEVYVQILSRLSLFSNSKAFPPIHARHLFIWSSSLFFLYLYLLRFTIARGGICRTFSLRRDWPFPFLFVLLDRLISVTPFGWAIPAQCCEAGESTMSRQHSFDRFIAHLAFAHYLGGPFPPCLFKPVAAMALTFPFLQSVAGGIATLSVLSPSFGV